MEKELAHFSLSIDEAREVGSIYGLEENSDRNLPTYFNDLHSSIKNDINAQFKKMIDAVEQHKKVAEKEIVDLQKEIMPAKERADALRAEGITQTISGYLVWAGYVTFAAAAWSIIALLETNVLRNLDPVKDLLSLILLSFSDFIASIPFYSQLVMFVVVALVFNWLLRTYLTVLKVKKFRDNRLIEATEKIQHLLILLLIILMFGFLGISIKAGNIALLDASHYVVGTGVAVVTTSILILFFYVIGADKNKLILSKRATYFLILIAVLSIFSLGFFPLLRPSEGSVLSLTLLAIYLVISSFCLANGLVQTGIFRDEFKKNRKVKIQREIIEGMKDKIAELHSECRSEINETEKEYFHINTQFLAAFDAARLLLYCDQHWKKNLKKQNLPMGSLPSE